MFNDNQTAHKILSCGQFILCCKGITFSIKTARHYIILILYYNDEENILLCVAKPSGRRSLQEPCVVWTKPMHCMYAYAYLRALIWECKTVKPQEMKTRFHAMRQIFGEVLIKQII